MKEFICPICGMGKLIRNIKTEKVTDLFAGEIEIQEVEYSCPVCGESGDFFDENEKALEDSHKQLKSITTEKILDSFIKNGQSFASVERALEIPQRTFAKWKGHHTEPTAAALALLKYLYTFPWLLEVAEKDFNPKWANTIFGHAFVQEYINSLSSAGVKITSSAFMETDSAATLVMRVAKDCRESQPKCIDASGLDIASSSSVYISINGA